MSLELYITGQKRGGTRTPLTYSVMMMMMMMLLRKSNASNQQRGLRRRVLIMTNSNCYFTNKRRKGTDKNTEFLCLPSQSETRTFENIDPGVWGVKDEDGWEQLPVLEHHSSCCSTCRVVTPSEAKHWQEWQVKMASISAMSACCREANVMQECWTELSVWVESVQSPKVPNVMELLDCYGAAKTDWTMVDLQFWSSQTGICWCC